MHFNKTYGQTHEQGVYTADLEQTNLYEFESHEEWIQWQLAQEKSSLVYGCIYPGASWEIFVAKPGAAELEAIAEEKRLRKRRGCVRFREPEPPRLAVYLWLLKSAIERFRVLNLYCSSISTTRVTYRSALYRCGLVTGRIHSQGTNPV